MCVLKFVQRAIAELFIQQYHYNKNNSSCKLKNSQLLVESFTYFSYMIRSSHKTSQSANGYKAIALLLLLMHSCLLCFIIASIIIYIIRILFTIFNLIFYRDKKLMVNRIILVGKNGDTQGRSIPGCQRNQYN